MESSLSTEKSLKTSSNHQTLPNVASRPLTEDGRPLKCYVGNLSSQCRMYHLREKFSPFGTIINVELKPNIGCGFVEYVDPESCIKACNALDGTELFGQTLRVETQKQVHGIRKTVTEKLEGCFNCGAKNHWAKHCPNMPPPGTPQNVPLPTSSSIPSDSQIPMKPLGGYDIHNCDSLRCYPEDFSYRQPYLNGYGNSCYYVPRDYAFRDRDIRDLRSFQKYRNHGHWNYPSAKRFPENTIINYKRYANAEKYSKEFDQLPASSKISEPSVESKSKPIKSLNDDKNIKIQSDSSQTENILKKSEKEIKFDKRQYNDQDTLSQDYSAIARKKMHDRNNESLEENKVSLYQSTQKEPHSFAFREPQHYDDYYNYQDYMYPEFYDRAYLAPKYPNDNPHYNYYMNYTARYPPLRLRSRYSDGYRYYSEPYTPYDSNYRDRKSLQHLACTPNARMDYTSINCPQGYSRRCSPSSNLYSSSFNYGYPYEYR
ncbi:hypothetical protein PCANB_001584 [Pneumocystis canis]|nr:hypothetical protein PCK1_001458 [Pneumocystis canis]KAG5439285.1 hypothetical protein PCANB_001584 [Pneumocystis canis]